MQYYQILFYLTFYSSMKFELRMLQNCWKHALKCGKCRFRGSKFKNSSGGMPPDPPRFVSSIYLQQSDFNLDPPLVNWQIFIYLDHIFWSTLTIFWSCFSRFSSTLTIYFGLHWPFSGLALADFGLVQILVYVDQTLDSVHLSLVYLHACFTRFC